MVYLQVMWWVVLRVKSAQILLSEVEISKHGERGMLLDTAAITVKMSVQFQVVL
jgi:hypothetical protein